MTPKKIKTIVCFFALFAFFAVQVPTFGEAKTQLNLLIVTADDMNADSWWNNELNCTPKLDAFARTCYRFEHAHVSAPICQPSRSALMTGRVPHRNGALGFNPIHLDVPTLTEVMSSNGYFTAAMNKLVHMAPASKFDWDLKLDGSGKNSQVFREQFEQCLKTAADQKKPFFINANITDPHRPFAGSRDRDTENENGGGGKRRVKLNEANSAPVKMFQTNEITVPAFLEDVPDVRKEVAQYYSSVRRLNETFAQIMEALKAAKHEDDTVIVFLSDHGMSFPYSKATLYYNGTHSPILFRWPGLKPFNNTNDMVSSVDIMPTVLDVLKIEPPKGMDGRSLVPLIEGEKLPDTDHVFTHVNTVSSGKSFPGRCIRTKTRAYIWNSWPDGKTRYRVEAMGGLSFAAMEKWGEHDSKVKGRVDFFLYRGPEEFYDNQNDPTERHNLIDDPRYQKEIAEFKKKLLKHMEQTNDPLVGEFRKVCDKLN